MDEITYPESGAPQDVSGLHDVISSIHSDKHDAVQVSPDTSSLWPNSASRHDPFPCHKAVHDKCRGAGFIFHNLYKTEKKEIVHKMPFPISGFRVATSFYILCLPDSRNAYQPLR